jgi:hypothetical protein
MMLFSTTHASFHISFLSLLHVIFTHSPCLSMPNVFSKYPVSFCVLYYWFPKTVKLVGLPIFWTWSYLMLFQKSVHSEAARLFLYIMYLSIPYVFLHISCVLMSHVFIYISCVFPCLIFLSISNAWAYMLRWHTSKMYFPSSTLLYSWIW